MPILCEVQHRFQFDDYQKTGLDVLFYGQDHYDTLAILSMKDDMKETKVADLMNNQKLLSNKDLLIRNFGQLIENLSECEDYIQDVIVRTNPIVT
jgi:phage/plasmid primase-like uncharacterized protein